jgi:hypothetical protein
MIISAAMRDLPKGGLMAFRNATTAKASVLVLQIHFEPPKVSAVLAACDTAMLVVSAAATTTNRLEADIVGLVHVPAILESRGNLARAKESKA